MAASPVWQLPHDGLDEEARDQDAADAVLGTADQLGQFGCHLGVVAAGEAGPVTTSSGVLATIRALC